MRQVAPRASVKRLALRLTAAPDNGATDIRPQTSDHSAAELIVRTEAMILVDVTDETYECNHNPSRADTRHQTSDRGQQPGGRRKEVETGRRP